MLAKETEGKKNDINHFLRQMWLVLREKLMEINSNFFSRMMFMT